ncbi:hypothetical protein ACFSC3_03500 [Sphingomonas floccifaciens]|uniref:Uncharacterized protein n=1 Tax=Sphingomonas floccifaciens TaxID=1844115 RepID=A0ABW4N980_9SPHN
MAENTHNRLRQLQGLISIDAWHGESTVTGHVDLRAYVNFDEARLGGQSDDEVAFRLSLRKAELILRQSEPKSFKFDPAHLWRGDKSISVERKTLKNAGRKNIRSRSSDLEASKSPKLSFSSERSSEDSISGSVESKAEESSKTINVSFSRNDPTRPGWILKPREDAPRVKDAEVLYGQPWDEDEISLAKLIMNKNHASAEMLSMLSIYVICRQEDLVFHDIKIKGQNGTWITMPEASPKRFVIQEYLRKSLMSEGLPGSDLHNPFAIVHLGEAISEFRKS